MDREDKRWTHKCCVCGVCHWRSQTPHMHTIPSPEAANVLRERVARRTTQDGDLSDIQPGKTVCCNVLKPGHLKLVKSHDFIAWIKEENVSVVDIQAAALTQSSPSRQTRVSKRVARGWEDAGRIEAAEAAKTARKKRRIDRFMRPFAVVSRVARWCWSTFLLVFWYLLGSIESIGAATVKRVRADAHAAAAAVTLVLSTDTFVSEWTYECQERKGHISMWTGMEMVDLEYLRDAVVAALGTNDGRGEYCARDYLLWFFLVHGPRSFSMNDVGMLVKRDPATVRRHVDDVIKVLDELLSPEIGFLPYDELLEDGKASGFCRVSGWDRLALVIGDGSGSQLFEPSQAQERQSNYCHWKKKYMKRWFIFVTAMGRIVYVSPCYPGKVDDIAGMRSDHCDFYSKFNAFYLPFVRNQRFNDSADLCVGGDKGYTYLPVNTGDDSFPAGTQILITQTGKIDVSETEDPDGKQSAAQSLAEFQKKHPEVTFSAEFQKYRAVVERVIGRMKQLSNTVRGPRQVPLMDSKLDALLRIYCGIINRQLKRNKYWFVRET